MKQLDGARDLAMRRLRRLLFSTPRIARAWMRLRRRYPELRALAAVTRNGDVVADVGANTGEYSVFLSRIVGRTGRIHAIEPNPTCCEMISRQARNLPITVHQTAISDTESTGQLNVPGADHAQGALVVHRGIGSWAHHPEPTQLTVPVTTLDRFVSQNMIHRLDVLKIDVEGAEVNVLRGGLSSIASLTPVLMLEVCEAWLRDFGSSPRDLIMAVHEFGYDVVIDVGGRFDGALVQESMNQGASRNWMCLMTVRHPSQITRLQKELRP